MFTKRTHCILLFIITAIAAIAFIAPAGEIKGTTKDKATGEALPFVNLVLRQQGKQVQTATSNIDGIYSFKNLPAGSYDLEANYIGYAKTVKKGITVTDSKVTTIDLALSASTLKLDEIEVTKKSTNRRYRVLEKETTNTSSANDSYNYSSSPSSGKSPEQYNTEEYDKINDNEFKEVKNNALSTFSIDVDAASYSNVRRFIMQGSLPPKDAVRVEEMINYFSYDYPQPKGDDPFSITMEMAGCPWNKEHKLVHIGLQGKEIAVDKLPSSNLVFLLDVSGSMDEPNKLPLLKSALELLTDQLRPEDHVSIVVYAGAAGVVLPSTPGNRKDKIKDALEELQAGGSTAGGAGILLAYKIAKENFIKGGNNRVILATDGDFNVGVSSDGELVRMIEEKREEGVFLTVLGFGTGNYKDSKMEQLADKGNGNYAYIDNLLEAKKVLVKEMGATLNTIAKDVKIQVEFNPAFVKSYRLVGYENRVLANEDFNDDKKDAGDMGAGHAVTALYEIIPAGSSENTADVNPLKYQVSTLTAEAKASSEVMTVKFRYKEPDGKTSKLITQTVNDRPFTVQASENFRFSAAVAEFGMLLRDSKFKGNSSYKDLLAMAKEAKGKDEEGYRAEFIRLVEMSELLDKKN
jgi:Ca-activated chloride channel family protein